MGQSAVNVAGCLREGVFCRTVRGAITGLVTQFLSGAELVALRTTSSQMSSDAHVTADAEDARRAKQRFDDIAKQKWLSYASAMALGPRQRRFVRWLEMGEDMDDSPWPRGFARDFPRLRVLELPPEYNTRLYSTDLPQELKKVTMSSRYNWPIDGLFPDSLIFLQLGFDFDQPIRAGGLPAGLVSLMFGYSFNQELTHGMLPPGLMLLLFGPGFTQPLRNIPRSLSELYLGTKDEASDDGGFDQPIEPGCLPPSLRVLELSWWFSQRLLPGVLPPRLERLQLGGQFAHPIEPDVLPVTLERLRLFDMQHLDEEELLRNAGDLPRGMVVC